MSRALSWLWLSLFTVAWLLPIAYHSLVRRRLPGTPGLVVPASTCSCIFVTAADWVPLQYIQVLRPGETKWTTEDEGHYLRMSPFGFRTRADEMLRKGLDNEQALRELAFYVRARYARRTGIALSA